MRTVSIGRVKEIFKSHGKVGEGEKTQANREGRFLVDDVTRLHEGGRVGNGGGGACGGEERSAR